MVTVNIAFFGIGTHDIVTLLLVIALSWVHRKIPMIKQIPNTGVYIGSTASPKFFSIFQIGYGPRRELLKYETTRFLIYGGREHNRVRQLHSKIVFPR